jgi:hypothetical protein
MADVLPVDASLEDIEVDPSLPFLDGYVQFALNQGAATYAPPNHLVPPIPPPSPLTRSREMTTTTPARPTPASVPHLASRSVPTRSPPSLLPPTTSSACLPHPPSETLLARPSPLPLPSLPPPLLATNSSLPRESLKSGAASQTLHLPHHHLPLLQDQPRRPPPLLLTPRPLLSSPRPPPPPLSLLPMISPVLRLRRRRWPPHSSEAWEGPVRAEPLVEPVPLVTSRAEEGLVPLPPLSPLRCCTVRAQMSSTSRGQHTPPRPLLLPLLLLSPPVCSTSWTWARPCPRPPLLRRSSPRTSPPHTLPKPRQ